MFNSIFKKFSDTKQKTKFELFCEKIEAEKKEQKLINKTEITKTSTEIKAEIIDRINRIEIKLDNGFLVLVPYDRSKYFSRASQALDMTGHNYRIVQNAAC